MQFKGLALLYCYAVTYVVTNETSNTEDAMSWLDKVAVGLVSMVFIVCVGVTALLPCAFPGSEEIRFAFGFCSVFLVGYFFTCAWTYE